MPTSTTGHYFPSHPNIIRTSLSPGDQFKPGSRYQVECTPFTGDEPQPEPPMYADQLAAIEQHPEAEQAIQAEYDQRVAEYEVTYKLWREARYRKELTPLITAAAEARSVVDAALRELDEAWAGLDTATVWQVAVKRVLDAHDAALTAMEQWTYIYAQPLAVAESTYPASMAGWWSLAKQLGHEAEWDIGYAFRGGYDPIPIDKLNSKIDSQRQQLAEIAKFTKQDDQ
jgi:hypothetical protein